MNQRQLSRHCTLERIASVENLWLAARKARRGKGRRPDVEDWWLRRESAILALREELRSGAYTPGPYHLFEIREPKRRLIAAAPFRDRVVHHALCHLLAPALERRFIARSFSCQVGKGTTAARECCRELTNRFRYVLKCDVRKFFPSIDHELLREPLAQWIACPGALGLVDQILGSHRTGSEVPPALFPGDDWLAVAERPRGLPIGNLTSQLWGNFYLDSLDHWITETQRHGAYLRYTDDFLLFGDDKERLWALQAGISEQLARLRLKLAEPKSRLLAAREGVPFCGLRFLPGRRPRILGATKRRFEARRATLFVRGDLHRLGVSVFAWYQFSREANSEGLRRAYTRWPLASRLKRRQRSNSQAVRGGSWNNDNPESLSCSYRNHDHPTNRNDPNGFRCVVGMGASVGKASKGCGLMRRRERPCAVRAKLDHPTLAPAPPNLT